MRLCLSLGIEHPDYLPLDARQFLDWLEFSQIEPFGDDWRQTALLAHISAAKGGVKDGAIEDYMPIVRPRKTDAEIQMKLHGFFLNLQAAGANSDA